MIIDFMPDVILAFLVICMAWGAMHAPSRQDAMALFVAFGLLVALIWARLGAPDLALAEAAIGAGLTGVLLLQAARQIPAETGEKKSAIQFFIPLVFVVVAIALFAGHMHGNDALLLSSEPDTGVDQGRIAPGASAQVYQAMTDSGVGHPVTAVLLNFRAWDTLLELLVLLLALSGLRQLYPHKQYLNKQYLDKQSPDKRYPHEQTPLAKTYEALNRVPQPWPLLLAWSRFLAPLLVLTGGYLLWRGADAPGGAFQAGALLAAAAVVLRLSGLLPPLRWSSLAVRLMINIGALAFLAVAALTLTFGQGWLNYPASQAGMLIVGIELFATISIAVTLTLLVVGEYEDLHT